MKIREINSEYLDADRLSGLGFTDTAIWIITDAKRRAMKRGLSGTLPQLVILWSLVRWERTIATAALQKCTVDFSSFEKAIEHELVNWESADFRQDLDFIQISDAIKAGCAEAAGMGADYVGSEHILLGLWQRGDKSIAKVKEQSGATYEELKHSVAELLDKRWC